MENSALDSFIHAHCHFSRSGRERKVPSEDAMRPSTTIEYAFDSIGSGLGPGWSLGWNLNAPIKNLRGLQLRIFSLKIPFRSAA